MQGVVRQRWRPRSCSAATFQPHSPPVAGGTQINSRDDGITCRSASAEGSGESNDDKASSLPPAPGKSAEPLSVGTSGPEAGRARAAADAMRVRPRRSPTRSPTRGARGPTAVNPRRPIPPSTSPTRAARATTMGPGDPTSSAPPASADPSSVRPRAGGPFRWKRGEQIGKGSYGTVYVGLNQDSGALVAVKEISFATRNASEVEELRKEINLMRSLRHKNVVAYMGTEVRGQTLFILTEWVPGVPCWTCWRNSRSFTSTSSASTRSSSSMVLPTSTPTT